MKFKTYLYNITKIVFGMLLVLSSMYDVIKYGLFLDRLDHYFDTVLIFDFGFIEALAPLVPFEKFIIGFFLLLGVFKKKALIAGIVLFSFSTMFLLDANQTNCAFIHLCFCIVSIVLLKKDHYDLNNSNEYAEDSYQVIQ